MALGEEVALEPLEPPDRLVEQAANLGDVTCGGKDLRPHSVTHGRAHVLGKRSLELGGGGGERLDLARASARALPRSRLRRAGRQRRPRCAASPARVPGYPRARGYSPRRMDTSSLEYDLPPELVAQVPVEPRDASRLLVYRRSAGTIEHRIFRELPDILGGRARRGQRHASRAGTAPTPARVRGCGRGTARRARSTRTGRGRRSFGRRAAYASARS